MFPFRDHKEELETLDTLESMVRMVHQVLLGLQEKMAHQEQMEPVTVLLWAASILIL